MQDDTFGHRSPDPAKTGFSQGGLVFLCDRYQQAGATSTSPRISWPLAPGSPHASRAQGGHGISGCQAAPSPGAARADALCVSVPRPRTRPDRSGRAPAPRRPGGDHGRRWPLCQGGASFSLLRTWSCWPIIVRNLRIVGKSKIYENKLKRSMKMCWKYRPVRCNNKNTRLVSPNIVWTRFNSIFRRFQFPFP